MKCFGESGLPNLSCILWRRGGGGRRKARAPPTTTTTTLTLLGPALGPVQNRAWAAAPAL